MRIRTCICCDRDFETRSNRALYCSHDCDLAMRREKWQTEYRNRQTMIAQVCAVCGKDFERPRRQDTCSYACSRVLIRQRQTVPDRFWSKVEITGADDCWEWQSALNNQGYGRFSLADTDERRIRVLAHRFAYELTTAEDLRGRMLLHSCDNPPCCNPAHLRPGTQSDNMRDALAKGRLDLSGLVIGQRMSTRAARQRGQVA